MTPDFIIKVCGMCHESNIREVAALSPTMMGFIFHSQSPRYAERLAPEIVKTLPSGISPVGVFVNTPIMEVDRVCQRYGISTVQLHGDESPDDCATLRSMGYRVIKTFGISDTVDWRAISRYENVADMFLFDTKTASRGGSGKKFGWHLLSDYPSEIPYILSGGISASDCDAITHARLPKMAGVDLNSRFETSPGVKDVQRLHSFIVSLRKSI